MFPIQRPASMILFVVASLYLLACTTSADQMAPTVHPQSQPPSSQPSVVSGQARLRILNSSAVDLEQLVVRFPNTPIAFGTVPAGATTDYQPVPGGVYGYAAYEAVVDGQAIHQGVDDWLGERPLEGSAFTYVLSIDPQQPLVPIQSEVRRDE